MVGASLLLALNNNEAGQHFQLLQPGISHNKSCETWISMLYLNHTHFYTSQGKFICRSAVVVGAPSFLELNNNEDGQHFWLLWPDFSDNKSC